SPSSSDTSLSEKVRALREALEDANWLRRNGEGDEGNRLPGAEDRYRDVVVKKLIQWMDGEGTAKVAVGACGVLLIV
ncbi:hypothetical protein HK097_006220, partial [Rhizophlyctis rosea]